MYSVHVPVCTGSVRFSENFSKSLALYFISFESLLWKSDSCFLVNFFLILVYKKGLGTNFSCGLVTFVLSYSILNDLQLQYCILCVMLLFWMLIMLNDVRVQCTIICFTLQYILYVWNCGISALKFVKTFHFAKLCVDSVMSTFNCQQSKSLVQ